MPSPLNLRSRLKRALGKGAPPPSEPPSASEPVSKPKPAAPAAPPPAARTTPAPEATPVPAVAAPVGSVARPPRARKAAASSAAPADKAGTKKVSPEKIAKHRKKTRKGVLKWLDEQEGGEASMKDMHDYSERRFFVSHKPFSDLMEYLIDNVLITFDHGAGIATITDDGRDFYKA